MGKARSYEMIEYKKAIMSMICKSEKLITLLGCKDVSNPEDVIPYRYCFPHEYIPETITRTEKFVNYDIHSSLDYKNDVYRDLSIYFYVVCHQDVARYKSNGREYLWYDAVTCVLDEMLCENNPLGIGEIFLITNAPYYPKDEFKGRVLKFKVKDFTDGLKYGR